MLSNVQFTISQKKQVSDCVVAGLGYIMGKLIFVHLIKNDKLIIIIIIYPIIRKQNAK